MTASAQQHLALFGGGFDTSNLGVSALTVSVIEALQQRLYGYCTTVYDHTHGIRHLDALSMESNRVDACGARWSKAFYRSDSLSNIRFCVRHAPWLTRPAKRVRHAVAVLDISGGDSFTDLYGIWRYGYVIAPKLIAIENKLPLVLLPQTYGPFQDHGAKAQAEHIVKNATIAIARDERSYDVLKDLLGSAFDPHRHLVGVDVAFLLQPKPPKTPLPSRIHNWLTSDAAERAQSVVGFNVSGLIYNDPERAASRYKFVANYADAVMAFLAKLMSHSECNLLLVPHVITPQGHFESDPHACDQIEQQLVAQLGSDAANRVAVVPPHYDQNEMKWIISRCDWFCGTRMHSTIAGLSTGVSTAAISYSPKTLGVFETCGVGAAVVDPTTLGTPELVDALWNVWLERESSKQSLHQHLPKVIATANEQMDLVASVCRDGSAQ
ncbi:MAG: polysaccharide pyruvyl transferase family protein [Phycisphaeraceae bacterium]|nr:polysaccharide pyruvyl transferase family protein [Phycisphaerales bacterium]MCB9861006.1 polysaccharide pyruvyl transferase family protein [Phycisphaeraceae bacterium]